MKNLCLKIVLSAAASILTFGAMAQDLGPQWGADEADRKNNAIIYNYFDDAIKMKDYDSAVAYMLELIDKAPSCSGNLYLKSISLYKDKIQKAESDDAKKMLADSLAWLYDNRAEHFGADAKRGRAYILRQKALDYMRYAPNERATVSQYLKDAVEADEAKTDAELMVQYFNYLTDDFKLFDAIDVDTYLTEYEVLSDYMDQPQNADKGEQKEILDQLAVSSGALDCENLERIYEPQLKANPADKDLHAKAFRLLYRNQCEGEFFVSVMERLHNLDQSAATALLLAKYYEDRNDYTKAIGYLRTALNEETDPDTKENLSIRLAVDNLASKNSRQAAEYARQAISINPNSGLGYYSLAQAYAAGSTSCEEGFHRHSVYWLVHDNLVTAKRLMAGGDTQINDIDQQIANYRKSFPNKEDAFFMGLAEGSTYSVKCGWITGNATVRTVQ